MKNKKIRNLIIMLILVTAGVAVFIIGITNDQIPFGIAGLGFALAGISIEIYLKTKKDAVTEKNEKRSDIERYDERNVLINAKSGETINAVMDICTLIVAGLSVYFNVSVIGQTLIFSLLIIRIVVRPIIKVYYENQL